MKPWYMASTGEVQAFFDVIATTGLSDQSVLKRLKKFGKNIDSTLTAGMQKVFKATVRRNAKKMQADLRHIVPGDVVLLQSGNRVPADIRLLYVNDLHIDQSRLTRDGGSVAKNTYALEAEVDLSGQKCMAFAGTFVTSGEGWGVIVATGNKTAQSLQLKKARKKRLAGNTLAARRLRRHGVVINNSIAPRQLKHLNKVFINAQLTDAEVLELIRKVQLQLKLACKFVLSSAQAARLQDQLLDALALTGAQIAGAKGQQTLKLVADSQFITDVTTLELGKILNILKQNGKKVLYVTDGQQGTPPPQLASVSLIIGRIAGDDAIAQADLIAPPAKPLILSKIL